MAVMEMGVVSKAAEALRISQPAVSKLLQELEADTGLQLFERSGRRLLPTKRAMRLYEEVERIFGGVHQLARAVEVIRREERGHLLVGCMPALSGRFISRVLAGFHSCHPETFVSIEARSSQFLIEAIASGRLDVAIVTANQNQPLIITESFKPPPCIAILPAQHPLVSKLELEPGDFRDQPFIGFMQHVTIRKKVDAVFDAHGVKPNIVMEATTATAVGELVAAGLGISIADPLGMEFLGNRVAVRPFHPTLDIDYSIIRPARARDGALALSFIEEVRATSSNFHEADNLI